MRLAVAEHECAAYGTPCSAAHLFNQVAGSGLGPDIPAG